MIKHVISILPFLYVGGVTGYLQASYTFIIVNAFVFAIIMFVYNKHRI